MAIGVAGQSGQCAARHAVEAQKIVVATAIIQDRCLGATIVKDWRLSR